MGREIEYHTRDESDRSMLVYALEIIDYEGSQNNWVSYCGVRATKLSIVRDYIRVMKGAGYLVTGFTPVALLEQSDDGYDCDVEM